MCLLEGGGGKGKKVHVSGLKDSIRTDVVERVRQSVRCHLKCFEGCLCMLGVCVCAKEYRIVVTYLRAGAVASFGSDTEEEKICYCRDIALLSRLLFTSSTIVVPSSFQQDPFHLRHEETKRGPILADKYLLTD